MWEAEINTNIIIEDTGIFLVEYLRDAHGKILVNMTSKEHIGAKCNSSKKIGAS
jgi:hypothetical protein